MNSGKIDIPDWGDWLPRSGFLNRYLFWTKNHEGPAVFQFWTGLTILSAAIGRRWCISKGFYHVYPTLYTLLVAPTGRCRKTRTSLIGTSLLETLAVRQISTKITPEALVHVLKTIKIQKEEGQLRIVHNSEGFIYASELTVLLGKQTYNDGLIDLLTDFADAPDYWSNQTKSSGKMELRNVGVVILACSTAEWLGEAIPQRAFGGGFLARIIFVVQDHTSRVVAIPKPQDEAIKAELLGFLKKLQAVEGTFTFSPESVDWYEKWYATNRDAISGDLRLNGYYERRPDHLLRVAMLMSLADECYPVLTPKYLDLAHQALAEIEPHMHGAVAAINATNYGRDSNRVLSIIAHSPEGCSYEEIMDRLISLMPPKVIDELLRGLVTAGKIEQVLTVSDRNYRLVGYGNGHRGRKVRGISE